MGQEKKYTVGKRLGEWEDDNAQNLTFIVTDECNLRCKYCYVTHKQSGKVMSLEVAKKFIDLILNTPSDRPAVVLEFIGGEPLLEAELIEQICDYFKKKAFVMNHPWYWKYRISISTNGVNYSSEAVQRLIEKNNGKISVGVTIDGTREKHDMQRVFPDGSGSYDIIMKSVPKWLSQFPGSTKVTFASDDLPLLKESIIHLWKMGITEVAANVVFEDVWKDGDDQIFENQLKELADYIIENDLYDQYVCTLFEEGIGNPYSEEELCNTSCGAGKMLAVNYEGNIYPCLRYYDHSLDNRPGYIIGNIEDGLFQNRLRVFGLTMAKHQCDEECRTCEVATGCSYCQGFSYDAADTATNFQRAKYICKMHKAQVRANNYYFAKLKNKKGIEREIPLRMKKTMLFLLGDDFVDFCSYKNKGVSGNIMEEKTIQAGLEYAAKHFYKPIFLHSVSDNRILENELYDGFDIVHMIPAEKYKNIECKKQNYIPIFTLENLECAVQGVENVIFTLEEDKMQYLASSILTLLEKYNRVNLKILNQSEQFDYEKYKQQLQIVKNRIVELYKCEGGFKEVNVITDILFMDSHETCGAGETLLAYAPNGKLYICPAFYAENEDAIGNIKSGIDVKNQHLYSQKYAPLCSVCDAYQCENCVFINKKHTCEVNISPDFQCIKSHMERDVACELFEDLKEEFDFPNKIQTTEYIDPYSVTESKGKELGYYREVKRG